MLVGFVGEYVSHYTVSVCVCEGVRVRACVYIRLLAPPDKSIKAFKCLSSLVLIIAVSHNSTGQNCRLGLCERKDLHPPVTARTRERERERESQTERKREITAYDHLAVFD